MTGGSALSGRLAHGHRANEPLLRDFVPAVIGVLVLLEAVRMSPDDPPQGPNGWLVTVAWRKFPDAARADASRRRREVRIKGKPMHRLVGAVDNTL
jgi:hypothetical protein